MGEENFIKRRAWAVCRFANLQTGGAGSQKREGGVFEGELIPQCIQCLMNTIFW